jgi:hypothetical protein
MLAKLILKNMCNNHFAEIQHMSMNNADLDSVEKAAKKLLQKVSAHFLGITFLTFFFNGLEVSTEF